MYNSATSNQQYNSIDLLKIIMAIFVIAIHTHPFENFRPGIFLNIYNIIVSTAVPFFFISSGFLISNKIENLNNIDKVWKYLIKMVKLYLIWTIIYMPLTIYGYVNNNHSFVVDILAFIRGLFFIGEHYNSWILWYLLSLIYSTLLTGILLKYKVKIKIIYFISILLFIFANIMTSWVNKIDVLHYSIRTPIKYYSYVFLNGRLFTGMFYFVTGIIISRHKYDMPIVLAIGFMLFFCNIFVQELYSSIGIAVYSIIIFLLIVSNNIRDNIIFKKLREASTIFYFMHMIFWSIYTIIILRTPNHYGFDSFIITLMCCIIISIVLIKLKEYKIFKWLRYIIN
jgi:surface polysaccharide O-acyltransferase-like enzyme